MPKNRAAQFLRGAQFVLLAGGSALIGGALASTVYSHYYQARQERLFRTVERRGATGTADESSLRLDSPPVADPGGERGRLDSLVLGMIEVPRVGISAIVREGDDDVTLGRAVGHIRGTARPGERGNMGLAGHRDTFFRGLRKIAIHDKIRFSTLDHQYEYRVDSVRIVPPSNTTVLETTGEPVLTLVTCFPFQYVGNAPDRFVVRASYVSR